MISPRSFCYQLSTDVLTALHESVGLYEYDGSPASRISTVPGISVREVSSPDTSELFTTTTSLIWVEVQEVKIRVSFTPGAHECTGKAAWLGLYIPVSKSQGGYKLELTNSFPSEPVGNYVQSASNPDTKWGTVSIPVHPPCQRVHTIPVPTTVTTPSSVAIPSAHESIPCCFSDAALMRCDGLVPIIPLSWKYSSQETSESACSQACIEKVAAETMGTHWWWVKRSRDILEQQGGEVPLAAQYIPITHADGSLFGITLIVWIVDGESTTDTSCTTCPTTDASSELTRAGHTRTQPHLMDRTMVQRVVTRVWDFVVGRALARPGWRSNCSPRETKRNNKWPQYFLVVSGRSYLMLEGDSNGMLSTENSTPPLLWELECKHVPCIANSEALEQLEGSLGIRHLPEISYVQNFLCLWFRSPPGTFFFEIGFDLKSALSEARDGYALGSIRRIEEAEGIRFEVEPSARWRNESQARRFKGSTSSCAAAGTRSDASLKTLLPVAASELRVFEAHIDWAFRSEYFGKVTFGNATASVSCTSLRALCDALRREGESPRNVDETTMLGREEGTWCSQMTWANDDGSLRSIQVRCASGIHEAERLETEAIDFATLRRTDVPIQFFECVDLFEDELHDCGTSHMTVRVRVMPTCWFVLLQHIVRVDGVALRLTETRWFADKKTPNKVAVSQVSWLLLLKNLTSTTEVHKRGNTQMRKEQNINVNDPSWRAQLTKTSAYTVVFEF